MDDAWTLKAPYFLGQHPEIDIGWRPWKLLRARMLSITSLLAAHQLLISCPLSITSLLAAHQLLISCPQRGCPATPSRSQEQFCNEINQTGILDDHALEKQSKQQVNVHIVH